MNFRILSVCISLLLVGGMSASKPVKKVAKDAPLFTHFKYQGKDKMFHDNPLGENEFYSSILQGCYPDPSICRKGDDYYLVTSTFAMFPGVPIFHSTDLVNWKQIGHVLDRTSQLKVEDCGISAGVYAPAICYNKYNDTFYMITTQFSGGFGNIVVKTKNPMQGWSDPIKLAFDGIDPSLFFDEDGKAYVVHNDAPRGEPLYGGHRAIKIWEYDLEKDCIVQGTDSILVDGGRDISQKPDWIEAPHIYKKDGFYYLMCAEGGTGDNHSEVIFKSKHVKGPYVPAANNPILTQRHLPKDRPNKIDWAGHADLVEGKDGKYYGVFLGIRPNDKGYVNTGRETFILPVDWSGDYPVFENGLLPLACKQKMEGVENKQGKDGYFPNGNFVFEDTFTTFPLDDRWISMRGPREAFISKAKKGGLQIVPMDNHINEVKPISALFHRQQHICFEAETTLEFRPKSEADMAGMVCYQSENYNYAFVITARDKETVLILQKTDKGQVSELGRAVIDSKQPVTLKVEGDNSRYTFSYSQESSIFNKVGGIVSGDILSTNVAGGFTGNLIGLYATK